MNKRRFHYVLTGGTLLLVALLVFAFYHYQTGSHYNCNWNAPASSPCFFTIAGLCLVLLALIYFHLRLANVVRTMRRKLDLSRQQLQSALDAVGDAAWHFDIATGDILCNSNFYTLLGHEPGAFALSLEKLSELTHPEDVAHLKQIIHDYINGHLDAFQLEFRVQALDDRWVWLLWRGKTVEWDNAGNPLKIAGTSIDITERKKAKALLRASEERYRLVVENMDEYIFIVCRDDIVFATPNLAELVTPPFTINELLKCLSQDNTHPHRETPSVNPSPQLEKETIYGGKGRIRLTNGQERWMETHSSPVLWEDHPARLICWRDITDKIVTEQREKQLETHLFQTQKMSALASMAERISRQYRNYMQIIGGNVELALSAAHPAEEYYNQLKKIESVVSRSTDLMNMFASFSSQDTPSSKEIVDLNATLEGLYPTLQCIIPRNITLRYLLKAENRIQAVPPLEIGQAIMNLVLNACDAMPGGGDIVVYSHDIHPGPEQGHTTPFVGLDVIDQGDGIPEEIKSQIFDPFFTTKDKRRHMGLGLYTTYTLVNNCSGFIECKNVACGARFKLWFPAIPSSARMARVISFPIGGNETILLVDDNQDINATTAEYLRRFGYNVVPAYCAEEALHYYENNMEEIDLVIMDLVMPGIGGIEGIRKLKQINPEINIIVASAYLDDLFTDSDVRFLVRETLRKPYLAGGHILTSIRDVLDQPAK